MNLKPGSLLQGGRYRIESVLGQGGFGITYLAVQTAFGRKVAVKEFFMKEFCCRDEATSYVSTPSLGSKEMVDHFKQKFFKEATVISSFKNRHIINVYDVFEENGTAYYVMEYLEGGSLESLVYKRGPLDEATALKYVCQVSEALAEVHSRKLLHLDIKPVNIMLDSDGSAVLIDFGISKHYDDDGSQTSSGLVGLSEGYAPLEQYKKGGISLFSPATDVYSLGATLYTLLTGTRPPHATDVNDEGLPAMPRNISAHVRSAIEAAMQPRRKDRPQSVDDFMAMLLNKGEAPGFTDTGRTVVVDQGKTAVDITKRRNTAVNTPVSWPELKYKANYYVGDGNYQGGNLRITSDRVYFKPHSINFGSLKERYIEIEKIIGYKKGALSYMSIFTEGNQEIKLAVWKKDEIISEIEKRRASIFQSRGMSVPPLRNISGGSTGCMGVLAMILVGAGTALYSLLC